MIIWRNGKAGFVGRVKRLIKGVFDTYYSATSSAPAATTVTSYYTIYSRAKPIETVSMAKSISIHSTAQPIVVYSK